MKTSGHYKKSPDFYCPQTQFFYTCVSVILFTGEEVSASDTP